MLRVDRVTVQYGKVRALIDVSVAVRRNETLAIIGANGSGKSTLVNTVSGLLRPVSGSMFFLDKNINNLTSHEIVALGIVQVPEGRRLFGDMTVLENLEMGSHASRARPSRRESLEEVFGILPVLEDRKRQLAGTLSGGEQQMLAIGRALMAKPNLLMLDEPSLGLAPMMTEKVFCLVDDLHKRGTTILLVEQDAHKALQVADRAYVLENGRVVLEGTGNELLGNEKVKKSYLGI